VKIVDIGIGESRTRKSEIFFSLHYVRQTAAAVKNEGGNKLSRTSANDSQLDNW